MTDWTQSSPLHETRSEPQTVYPLENLLPVIRRVPAAGASTFDGLDDVLAIYDDRLFLFSIRRRWQLPMAAFERDGAEHLRAVRSVGARAELPLEAIFAIECSACRTYGHWFMASQEEGRELRIRTTDRRVARCFLPEEDATLILAALRELLGARFGEDVAANRTRPRMVELIDRQLSPAFRLVALFALYLLTAAAGAPTWVRTVILAVGAIAIGLPPVLFAVRELLSARLKEIVCLSRYRPSELTLTRREGSPAFRLAGIVMLLPLVLAGLAWGATEFNLGGTLSGWLTILTGVNTMIAIWLPLAMGALVWERSDAKWRLRRERLDVEVGRKTAGSDLSHRRPWRFAALGWVLKLLGLPLAFAGIAVSGASSLAHLIPGNFGGGLSLFSFVFYLCATVLIYAGYRLSLRSAESVRQTDDRPPVVYLRPFDADGRSNFNKPGFLTAALGLVPFGWIRVFGPLANFHPLRLARLFFSRSVDSGEEQLARFFSRLGPVVAIGKPGERIRTGGAARLYVGDAEWKQTVQNLLDESRCVVVQPSATEGVRWEIAETIQRVEPQRILFCLLLLDGRQARYDEFRLAIEGDTGLWLPRGLGDGMFLCFDRHWQPQLLPVRKRSPLVWPLTGCVANLPKSLAPFLATGEERPPIAAAPRPIVWAADALLACAAWAALFFLAPALICLSVVALWTKPAASAPGKVARPATSQHATATQVAPKKSVTPSTVDPPTPEKLRLDSMLAEAKSCDTALRKAFAELSTERERVLSGAARGDAMYRMLDEDYPRHVAAFAKARANYLEAVGQYNAFVRKSQSQQASSIFTPVIAVTFEEAKPAPPSLPAKSVKQAQPSLTPSIANGSTYRLPPEKSAAIKAERARLDKESAALDELKKQIAEEGRELDWRKASLNLNNQASVNSFNKRVASYNVRLKAADKRLKAFNEAVEKYNRDLNLHGTLQ